MGPTALGMPREDGSLSLTASGIFRTTFTQRRCLAATLRFNHDRQIKEGRRCYPLAGCRHRSDEHRKGSFEHDTSSGCFWRRYYPSHHDQGKSHLLP